MQKELKKAPTSTDDGDLVCCICEGESTHGVTGVVSTINGPIVISQQWCGPCLKNNRGE